MTNQSYHIIINFLITHNYIVHYSQTIHFLGARENTRYFYTSGIFLKNCVKLPKIRCLGFWRSLISNLMVKIFFFAPGSQGVLVWRSSPVPLLITLKKSSEKNFWEFLKPRVTDMVVKIFFFAAGYRVFLFWRSSPGQPLNILSKSSGKKCLELFEDMGYVKLITIFSKRFL